MKPTSFVKINVLKGRVAVSDQTARRRRSYMERGTEFDRFVFFTDAVYAIAATLLIVSVDVPRVPGEKRDLSRLLEALSDVEPQLFSFALGFWLITRFWMANHRFVARLAGIDRRFMGLTLVYLGLIAFLPFPTAFLGDNSVNPVSVSLFALTVAVIAWAEVVLLMYARRAGLLRAESTVEQYRWEVVASLVPTVIFLLSIPIAFLNPSLAMYFWLVTIPAGIFVGRRRPAVTAAN